MSYNMQEPRKSNQLIKNDDPRDMYAFIFTFDSSSESISNVMLCFIYDKLYMASWWQNIVQIK